MLERVYDSGLQSGVEKVNGDLLTGLAQYKDYWVIGLNKRFLFAL